jgi:uncharacterized protein
MPGDARITVRRLRFEFPDGLDPIIVPGQPEESYATVGLSLLLPYLEPYLIRTMRQARPRVTDASLLSDLDLFNGQEAQHYKQHVVFNEAVRIPESSKVKALEAELDADYHRYTTRRSLRWNLAYAEGFEAFTTAMARYSFEAKVIDRLHSGARDLFLWHLVEELEHRTVAFDVYEHVFGGYFYRLFVGLFAQWHLNRFVLRVSNLMLSADPTAFRKEYGGVLRGFGRTLPHLWRMTTILLPKVLATYLPWYTPRRIELSPATRALAHHYTERAATAAKPP